MEITPGTLEFKGSFQKQTTESLTLTNTTSTPLAFKVKTTAPKLYCVRPNASLLAPGESLDISVILQGFAEPLPSDYKCKDKFLLVSLPAPELTDASRVGENWSNLESRYKSQMVSKKLRVNYRISGDDGEEEYETHPSSADVHHTESTITPPFRDEKVYQEPALNNTREYQPEKKIVQEKPSSAAAQASPELQRELEALAQQVRSLSSKLDENERSGTTAAAAAAAAAAASATRAVAQNNEPINGVSLPVALLLVLISFLIGWLIF
ncbi:Vesicle-associated membrane protein-associated protein SCS2 [Spathaspora sp. JA1]|nr:Vesicle-associated membrane protein-associated protein SCS2 [Spathaspora sp. JA1]